MAENEVSEKIYFTKEPFIKHTLCTQIPHSKRKKDTDIKFVREDVCPYCYEDDFDLAGLKTHFEMGWCKKYNETEVLT